MFNDFESMVSQSALFSWYTVVTKKNKMYGAECKGEELLEFTIIWRGNFVGKNQMRNLISLGKRLWYVNWIEPVHVRVQYRKFTS
jgi:hypothetical protein